VATEAEHGEGDQWFWAVEAEGDTGDEADLGVGGLDEGVGESGVQGGVDRGSVLDDAALQRDEGGDAAAAGPGDPAVERLLTGLAFEHEHGAQALLEQVGPPESGIGPGDPVQLLALTIGEVLGVLPQRVAGPLERPGVPAGSAGQPSVDRR
jgi:hypothetical protein